MRCWCGHRYEAHGYDGCGAAQCHCERSKASCMAAQVRDPVNLIHDDPAAD